MAPPGLFMTLFISSIIIKALLEFLINSVQLKQIITPLFVLCVLGYQIGFVMAVSKENCGNIQQMDVLVYGLGYWILIFGVTFLAITMFPGWKQPFSNFFGYGIVNIMGIKPLLNKMMVEKRTTTDPKLNSIIQKIYEDHSLLINSLTPKNFNSAIKGLKGIFKPNIRTAITRLADGTHDDKDESIILLKRLANLVMLKDKVAENIWFATSGWLSLTYSSMLTISSKCNLSQDKLKKQIQDYQTSLKEQEKKEKEKNKKKQVLVIQD